MKLTIVSPERTLFTGTTDHVVVPGANGSFEILDHHAPIVSSLVAGKVSFNHDNAIRDIMINGGFIEVSYDNVALCVEEATGDEE